MRNCLFLCRWIFVGCVFFMFVAAQEKSPEKELPNEKTPEEKSSNEKVPDDSPQIEKSEKAENEQPLEQEAQAEKAENEQPLEQEAQAEKAESEQSLEQEVQAEKAENEQPLEQEVQAEKTQRELNLQGEAMTYENALKALNTGAYFEAQVILENLLEQEPENKDFLTTLAEIFYRQKDFNLAVDIYKKLTNKEIHLAQKDLLFFVDSLLSLGQKEEAIPLLDILSNKMGDVESLYKLGRIWLELGDVQNALSAFNAAYLAAPEFAPKDFGELKKHALRLYAQALKNREEELNRKRLEVQKRKRAKERSAQLQRLKQIFAERRKEIGYEKFIPFGKITPTERTAELFKVSMPNLKKINQMNQEALTYFRKGNDALQAKAFRDAVTYYQFAIDKQGDFVEAFYQQGIAFYLLDEYGKAINAFARALEHQKYFPRALFWQAHSYQKAKILDKAIDAFIIARKMSMDSGDFFILFDSFRSIKNLRQQGVRSKFQMDALPEKQIVWKAKKEKAPEKKAQNVKPTFEPEPAQIHPAKDVDL